MATITCQWNVTDKPTGASATFGNGDNATTTFSVDKLGIYKVTLTANSGGVTITSAPATITVLTPSQAASSVCITCHVGQAQVVDWQASIHATSPLPGAAACPSCHMPNGESHPGQNISTMGNVCSNCHTDTQGNVPGHPFAINGNPCIFCHNPHTAQGGACDACHECPPTSASHQKHYGGTIAQARYGDLRITQTFGDNGTTYIFGCGNCHPMNAAKHGNGVVDMELSNPLATAGSIKALNPASAAYVAGSTVFTDARGLTYTNGTCSNIYCHSYTDWTTPGGVPLATDCQPSSSSYWPQNLVITKVYKTVTWGSGPLSCSGCHANPPRSVYPANDGGAGNSHSWIDGDGYENLHNWNMGFAPVSCKDCHNDTVKQANTFTRNALDVATLSEVPISNHSKHVNGINDVSFDKQNPFVYQSYGGNTSMSLTNATYDVPTKTCMNVSCHINQTTVKWGTPYRYFDYSYECDRCHHMMGSCN